jgi:hypothetical protein
MDFRKLLSAISAWLRDHANGLALIAALIALGGFIWLVIDAEGGLEDNRATTTVTESAKPAGPPTVETTEEVQKGPKGNTETKKTVEKGATPEQPASTKTTVEKGERTFLERILGDQGLDILRWALAFLGALLVGAFVQKILLADFSIKFGGLELNSVTQASAKALKELETQLQREIGEVDAESSKRDLRLLEDLQIAHHKLELTGQEIAELRRLIEEKSR